MMSKQTKTWIPILLIGMFFLGLIFGRPYLLEWISKSQRNQLSQNQVKTINDSINSLYNYTDNGEKYELTFLEFGSTGCSACKNMERVMEQINSKYSDKVKVVFVNVTEKSNTEIVNFYGVAAIPTQVLLDKKGTEYFRHTGFISETDLEKHFK